MTAEVDWGEATVSLAGVMSVICLFWMRSCFSGACFVMFSPPHPDQTS